MDSSALIAIVLSEPKEPVMLDALVRAPSRKISAVTWFESHLVAEGLQRDAVAQVRFQDLLSALRLEIMAVDEELARIARTANLKYGRGRGHAARLNFGDCFSYALAKQTGEPLLFKGNDFSQTDIIAAFP